ncbi:hypothetical protein AVEN_108583-1 [Araneus ventricosus]|uniref:Tesmin/TSO1-like CXC domain-containing protein n=1 Tax=Araneus ventricosus TaxID=182803 RepID=A0A4Y2DK53_ARAVE|nr:hypothetical protein AVEN_108583-1 [Araneus ventricosus]
MDCSQSPPIINQLLQPFSLRYYCKCAEGCNLTCTCRKTGIKCSTICYHCKGQGCTNSPEDDNIITNSANQEADLEEKCQTLQVEKNDNKQTDIYDYYSPSKSQKK